MAERELALVEADPQIVVGRRTSPSDTRWIVPHGIGRSVDTEHRTRGTW
jgi:hypothetical protein